MWPVWYQNGVKREYGVWVLGMLIQFYGIHIGRIGVSFIGFLFMASMGILQHLRFRRMDMLQKDPLRCECGGHFVTPWELGFEAPADHLICNNEHGDGRGIPCENWIVTPPDYHSSTPKVKT